MSTVPSRSSVLLPAVLLACLFTSAPVFAKTYSAERYDSVVRLLPDGALHVTETVVFRFESGTFKEVFREIPLRRTDGIEVLEAVSGSPPPGRNTSNGRDSRPQPGFTASTPAALPASPCL